MNPLALIGWQRYLVYGGLVLAIGFAVWFHGYSRGERKLWEYQAEQATQAIAVVKRIEKVKEVVRVPYIKREVQIKTVFVEIEKESEHVPVRPDCNVTAGWMHSHDAAAEGGDRRDAGAMDDATDTGITEAQALAEIRANYQAFHQVANDLESCRAFVNGLKGVN